MAQNQIIAKATGFIVTYWAIAGGLILIAVMGATLLNSLGFAADKAARLIHKNIPGIPGYEDFVALGIGCAVAMFLPYCQKQNGHIIIDIIKMPKYIQKIINKIWLILLCAIVAFLTYFMALGMVESYYDRALSPVLGWRLWLFYIPPLVSLILWAWVIATQITGK